MENTKIYFIIEKTVWNFNNGEPRFSIMKDKAYNLNEATKMLIAYEQLNDQEEKTYYLQEVDLLLGKEKPLVLKDEVFDRIIKSNNNDKTNKGNGISEEMPF